MPGQKGGPGICKSCNKQKNYIPIYGKSTGICHSCYKKMIWKPKLRICKGCGKLKKHQAFGLCPGCYNSQFQIERIRAFNIKYYHNIDPILYKEITKQCVVCGFEKIVEMHHLDHDKTNNSKDNLAGLCPNHHKMLHRKEYQKEIFNILREKGFKVPEKGNLIDGFFKNSKSLG